MSFQEFCYKWLEIYSRIGTRYFVIAGSTFFIFYVFFKKPMLFRKIQPKFPKITDYGRDIAYSVLSMGIFICVNITTFFIIRPYTNLYENIADYGKIYYYFTFIWMFFLHDAYFYWMHRMMHLPKLFKYIHLVHHKSHNPTPWTAYAFHPLEAFLEALIIPLIAFSIPTHRSAIIIYMLFQISYNVYGHLGFEIMPKNFNTHWLGKWFNTAVAHNMHHKYSVQNYGLWTTFWDRIMGTMHEKYDETYQNTTNKV